MSRMAIRAWVGASLLLSLGCIDRCERTATPPSETIGPDPSSVRSGGTEAKPDAPLDAKDPLKDVVEIAAEGDATCGLTQRGDVYCWGLVGLGSDKPTETLPIVHRPASTPTRIEHPPEDELVALRGVDHRFIAVTKTGRMLWFGSGLRPLIRYHTGETKNAEPNPALPPDFVPYAEVAKRYPEQTVSQGSNPLWPVLASARFIWSIVDDVQEVVPGPDLIWLYADGMYALDGQPPQSSPQRFGPLPDGWKVRSMPDSRCFLDPGQELRCWAGGPPGKSLTIDNPRVRLPKPPIEFYTSEGPLWCVMLVDRSAACSVSGAALMESDPTAVQTFHWDVNAQELALQQLPFPYNPFGVCSLEQSGKVLCRSYVTTRGDDDHLEVPEHEIPGIENGRQIVAGTLHTCVLLEDSTVKCFGKNDHGQCGNGETSEKVDHPVPVIAPRP